MWTSTTLYGHRRGISSFKQNLRSFDNRKVEVPKVGTSSDNVVFFLPNMDDKMDEEVR